MRSYGVYCNTPKSGDKDKTFFKSLSEMGKGSFLELTKFDSIFDFMMAICYAEHGEDAFIVRKPNKYFCSTYISYNKKMI